MRAYKIRDLGIRHTQTGGLKHRGPHVLQGNLISVGGSVWRIVLNHSDRDDGSLGIRSSYRWNFMQSFVAFL
jgi:hypothetical protein